MPPTIGYSFGDIVLVPFPFTDQAGTKKRPAVIISSTAYNTAQRDLVIMAVTSQLKHSGIRLDADVVDTFKATGKGWQTRMNAALRDWLKKHPRIKETA
jgi:mRNA interferase MazF